MTELLNPEVPTETATGAPVGPHAEEMARVLKLKVAQGYRVESEHEAGAVVVMKGHKRWFGLVAGEERRSEISIDANGHATSRRI